MKYESPELVALTPAINAIQAPVTKISTQSLDSSSTKNELHSAYADWE